MLGNRKSEHYLKLLSLEGRRKTVPQLTIELNLTLDRPVCQSTVRNTLKSFNLNGRVAVQKPLLRPANIKKTTKVGKTTCKLVNRAVGESVVDRRIPIQTFWDKSKDNGAKKAWRALRNHDCFAYCYA